MTWAQRLKRVFGIDIETCPACGGAVRIIACIEDAEVIEKILAHLDAKAVEPEAPRRPPSRAPPRGYGGGWLGGRRHCEKCANRLAVGVDSGAGTPLRGHWQVRSTTDPGR